MADELKMENPAVESQDICACGHDHHGHDHHGHECGCGHDHDADPNEPTRCISCGAPIGEGVGHNRSMGRASFAFVGGFLIVNSYLLALLFPDEVFASELSAALGAVTLALPIVVTAIRDLIEGRVYMNELVALAILAAFASGDFRTAGIVAFFLLVTIIIESHTASGAQRSIEELIRLTPRTAHKIAEGGETEVSVSELALDDIISVRPGENFPVDGVIVRGESAVNQASITGESMPEDKNAGDEVYAGTLNISGSLEVRVTRLGKDTTLGKVEQMIRSAERNKTPFVRIIDRYAGYYTPTILMLAIITWWLPGGSMDRVISLLVISCPCAVVLATPTTIVAAVAAAARLGVLIKNINHLELAGKIRTVVFDKTGTLTEGELSVARLNPVAEGVEPAELLLTAISLEAHSNHPTAQALQRLAAEVGIPAKPVSGFQEVPGKGVIAMLDGKRVLVGRAAWLESVGVTLPAIDLKEHDSMSVVYVAVDDKVNGWIGFKDRIRPEAAAAINELKSIGVTRCAMVTGDRGSVAVSIASQLSIDDVRSDCLPETKVAYVEEVKKSSTVAVVGDGVNDAPALAAGDLGIAMGAIGSDIAINSASIALMTNDLRRVPFLIVLSRKTSAIMYQNLAFGLIFVLCGIVLSVFGRMNPIAAAALHTVSTLIVIFNSARLVRTGEDLTMDNGGAAVQKTGGEE
ncbi:MAG: cadmium-translocating P-type ATPase [Lentisphaeria bacterium]|jgi:Cd2+/Zn2+-exporting ATPase|nr:cadmium-translocating P-type ATPase [Lentisphaeria bacterium]